MLLATFAPPTAPHPARKFSLFGGDSNVSWPLRGGWRGLRRGFSKETCPKGEEIQLGLLWRDCCCGLPGPGGMLVTRVATTSSGAMTLPGHLSWAGSCRAGKESCPRKAWPSATAGVNPRQCFPEPGRVSSRRVQVRRHFAGGVGGEPRGAPRA